jgi:hypothetical protein
MTGLAESDFTEFPKVFNGPIRLALVLKRFTEDIDMLWFGPAFTLREGFIVGSVQII